MCCVVVVAAAVVVVVVFFVVCCCVVLCRLCYCFCVVLVVHRICDCQLGNEATADIIAITAISDIRNTIIAVSVSIV